MAWGMEDPAGRAREDLAMRHDPAWDRPRRRRPREGLLVILFIVLAAAAIWFTLQHEDDAAADANRVVPTHVSATTIGRDERSMRRPAPGEPGAAAGTDAIPRTVENVVACVDAVGTDGAAIARCLR